MILPVGIGQKNKARSWIDKGLLAGGSTVLKKEIYLPEIELIVLKSARGAGPMGS